MRRKYLLAIGGLLFGVVLLFIFLPRPGSSGGKFVPVAPGFKVPPYRRVGYEFLQLSPFEGGKMWIRTDGRWYFYDIEARQVLGELIDDWPIFLNGDQSKVLVHTDDPSMLEVFFKFLDKATGGKTPFSGVIRTESFRLLDLRTGESVRMGRLYQSQGGGSSWVPSPTFRYGFNWPTMDRSSGNVYICNLERERMHKVRLPGDPAGWWDDTRILLKSDGNDLALYDVETKKTSTLLPAGTMERFFRNNQLTNDLAEVRPFGDRAEGKTRFHLSEAGKRWQATNSILIKIQQPDGALHLLTNDFKFEWSDHFDSTGRYYLYSGREIGKASAAVFVRDLQDNTTRTLVEDTGERQFSIPRWYGDDVIYIQSNMLWQISLTNSRPTRLFPPPED